MSDVKRLADQHERYVAEMLGARQSRSSGNQWHDQADGRLSRYDNQFAWAFDCKCALPQTKSISISREMWAKLEEQAHGERPMLPLRWYTSLRGDVWRDLVVVSLHDFLEMSHAVERSSMLMKGDNIVDL